MLEDVKISIIILRLHAGIAALYRICQHSREAPRRMDLYRDSEIDLGILGGIKRLYYSTSDIQLSGWAL